MGSLIFSKKKKKKKKKYSEGQEVPIWRLTRKIIQRAKFAGFIVTIDENRFVAILQKQNK